MKKRTPKYSEEFKLEALKVIENNQGNVSATARELGLPMQTLSNWYRKANQGFMKGTAQYDSELVEALEENKRLKRELKVAKGTPKPRRNFAVSQGDTEVAKYAFIRDNQKCFCVARICLTLKVKLSSYYDRLTRQISAQQVKRNLATLLVRPPSPSIG